jgi:hypothetical protein
MTSINIYEATQGDEDPLDELGVRYWMDQMRKGNPIPAPVIMRRKNGRAVVVDGRKRLEAAKRLGARTVSACVIEELSADRFWEVRRALNQLHREGN